MTRKLLEVSFHCCFCDSNYVKMSAQNDHFLLEVMGIGGCQNCFFTVLLLSIISVVSLLPPNAYSAMGTF